MREEIDISEICLLPGATREINMVTKETKNHLLSRKPLVAKEKPLLLGKTSCC